MEEVIKKLDAIHNDLKEIKTDLFLLKTLQATQIEKQSKLEDKINEIEAKFKANTDFEKAKNVILYDVKEEVESSNSLFLNVKEIIKKAEVDIPDMYIVDVFRLGRKNINKTRPIVIKFKDMGYLKIWDMESQVTFPRKKES